MKNDLMAWEDVARFFGCGKSKALLIMKAIGTIRCGSTSYILRSDLERQLLEEGEIRISWPHRNR